VLIDQVDNKKLEEAVKGKSREPVVQVLVKTCTILPSRLSNWYHEISHVRRVGT
jgi:hypothetical protein